MILRRAANLALLLALVGVAQAQFMMIAGGGAADEQAQRDADFVTRATASGNIWANNFTDIYEAGVINEARSIASTQDIKDDSDLVMGVGEGQDILRETSIYLSGTGSVNAQTFDTTGAGDGSYNATINGVDTTEIDDFYAQFSVYYPRDTIAWRYPISGSTALKIANFGDNGGGQFVLAIDRFMGFPAGFVNTNQNLSQNATPAATFGGSNGAGWSGTGTHIQNAIDTDPGGATPTTKAGWLARYGYILGWLEDDMQWGENDDDTRWLDERTHAGFGWPDSRAAAVGVEIEIDGWTTFEVWIDRSGSELCIWGAPYGDAPTLMWEGTISFANTTSDVGEWYLLNYDTTRQAEIGVRPTPQHTYYDELIVSSEAIAFPNPGSTPYALTEGCGL
jgi:hypothetical protein